MLSKDYRLRKDKEVRGVMSKGRGFYSKLMGIKYLPNNLENSRFCIVVSNKISKKANKRNGLKRKLSEIIRLNLAKFKGNYDIVIIVRPGTDILEKKYKDLEEDLGQTLNKAGLLK